MRTIEEMLDEDGGLSMYRTAVTVFFITSDQEEAEAVAKEFETEVQESDTFGLKHFKVSWPGNLKKVPGQVMRVG